MLEQADRLFQGYRRQWLIACVLLIFYWSAVLLLFRQTALSIEAIWATSTTFAHGYLIIPISIWLVYLKRQPLLYSCPSGSIWATLLLLPAGFFWLLGSLADTQVVQQLALVMMLILGSWAIIGSKSAQIIVFPLLFLFFAVPMGLEFIPPMQQFTADVTVRLVEISGIPVYREGMQFSLPTGNWHVVEACSGVRYLIASITLGALYAYLNYHSWWRRAAMILLSIIVPIIANALRAYGLVMLGHLTDGRFGAGVDHLVYGWAFFGLVIFVLFWLGSKWAEPEEPFNIPKQHKTPAKNLFRSMGAGFVISMILVVASYQTYQQLRQSIASEQVDQAIHLPIAARGWSILMQASVWTPAAEGAIATKGGMYRGATQPVYLEIQRFPLLQHDGAEAVAGYRHLLNSDDGPMLIDAGSIDVKVNHRILRVTEFVLRYENERLRIWYWYQIGGHSVGNHYIAKLLEVFMPLLRNGEGTDRLVLVARETEDSSAHMSMQSFLHSHWTQLTEER
ncbi:MAG: exosortase A [Parahaliea sp.]